MAIASYRNININSSWSFQCHPMFREVSRAVAVETRAKCCVAEGSIKFFSDSRDFSRRVKPQSTQQFSDISFTAFSRVVLLAKMPLVPRSPKACEPCVVCDFNLAGNSRCHRHAILATDVVRQVLFFSSKNILMTPY